MIKKKLWGGRFSTTTHKLMEEFSASVQFDCRLYDQDIRGSIAHARMLSACGVLSESEFKTIEQGLIHIRTDIKNQNFEWSQSLEDVHMNIEVDLTRRIGKAGKTLHTGRSRNDQIATDIRLYLREEIDHLCALVTELQFTIIRLAERESDTIMPGYTHMQTAQPVTLGHHLLAWNEMFQRDYERLQDCRKRVNLCPLGSAALAGTGYPIDRKMTAKELGFDDVCHNSMDAVSDRDFMIEFNAAAAILMIHLSRISEELILWSSDSFRFIDLGDMFCTGSSIMPQKKNPDVAELTRGKSGRVNGNLATLLMIMKGQPLAYNRDNQEDKEPLFDTLDTVALCLRVFVAMMPCVKFHQAKMLNAAMQGYATATDLADYLVMKQIPFRDAHEIVGKIVDNAIAKDQRLDQIELTVLRSFSEKIEEDIYEVLTVEGSVAVRDHIGGTAPKRVKEEVSRYKKILAAR